MTNLSIALLGTTLLMGAGCASELTGTPPEPTDETGGTSGGEDNTFDHDNSGVDPWELLDRLQREGPPRYTSRVHSCPKMRVRTIGTLLASRGVDMTAVGATSAAGLYDTGKVALGEAQYASRVREHLDLSTASASRLFDIYAAAAPEIIANYQAAPACAGVGPLFDANDNCMLDAMTCLMGVPATLAHAELCNFTVQNASTIEVGKNLAVAALMAASHTCE